MQVGEKEISFAGVPLGGLSGIFLDAEEGSDIRREGFIVPCCPR
jgi:hypothetical protein